MVKQLITCTCSGTMTVDSDALSRATGLDVAPACSALCTREIETAAKGLTHGETMIACQQEARVFAELADELNVDPAPLVDLRDRAGWTADESSTLPKMAALLAEARLPAAPEKTMDVTSEGLCLVLGPAEAALSAAEALSAYLSVTVVLDSPDDVPPGDPERRGYDITIGRVRGATGALGGFRVRLDAVQELSPAGRGMQDTSAPRDGGQAACDIILDLRGTTPLFPAHEKREGYLRADPTHPPALAAAMVAASHLVGTFEQTLYVRAEPALCAHSRAGQTGCTRCLDLCPTGAILPAGDHVTVDPMICAGCGACSSACPSGAISYDAPPVATTLSRVQTMARAYLAAGGSDPRLLVVDAHGAEMIRLAARYGDGLPADVVPLEMPALAAFGHAETLAALAAGFAEVAILPGPKADLDAIAAQTALAAAIADGRVLLLDLADPDALSQTLFTGVPKPATHSPVRPLGTRRQVTRQAARALNPDTAQIPLPDGAPYGAVLVDTDACTLCLSCVSLCPSGALGDNPDLPQLRFQEDACLQCGLCAHICPEDAITYAPRLDLSPQALEQVVLNEEEPFACIECGTLFGVKSTVERVMDKLAGHSMFAQGDALKMIQMCDDCRVNAQYHSQNNPFTVGERPKPRTTDDYLTKRRDH
ncbi:MAG: (4Fe-4S)-binding protein [Rhodobacteraceae bacterium]|nr:(4Fe-4S)-binding protein [Paracoccaceae bacterium]